MNRIRRLKTDTRSTVLLFLVPAFVLYCLLVVIPVFQSARFSFYRWDGLGPMTRFIGLGNYRKSLKMQYFSAP